MRYIIGFILSIILIIFALTLIFRSHNNDATEVPKASIVLLDYANTDKTVEYTIDNPVSANQTHSQISITVGRDAATLNVYRGYQEEVLRTQTYPNNQTAYANFLRALQVAGYTTGKDDADLRDERGFCPAGRRYIYEIKDGATSTQRLWSTSCNTSIGNFKGNASVVRDLFIKQIPDYGKLTSNISL